MKTDSRQQAAAILVKVFAAGVALLTLPFLNEGLENIVLYGPQLWSLECLGMALVPGAMAYGLWRKRRWAWKIALWVSVPGVVLAPLAFMLAAALAYSANANAVALAVVLGVLSGSVAYLLTRPATRELFGVASGAREIVRMLKVAGTVVFLVAVGYAAWGFCRHVVQRNSDSHVVADINKLVEQQLNTLTADGPIIRRHGAFKSWEPGSWSRRPFEPSPRDPSSLLQSRIEANGMAHFEKDDVQVHLTITRGSPVDAPQIIMREMYLSPDDPYMSDSWSQMEAFHPEFVPD
jgi:hypothetical protein